MSYTSGRTVNSTGSRTASPVAAATRDVRSMIKRLWPENVATITITSTLTADPATLEPRVRTVVTFPVDLPRSDDLRLLLYALPNIRSLVSTRESFTITRTA